MTHYERWYNVQWASRKLVSFVDTFENDLKLARYSDRCEVLVDYAIRSINLRIAANKLMEFETNFILDRVLSEYNCPIGQ